MPAQLRAASVTLAFMRTVWHGLKISCMPITLTVIIGLIDPMTTGIIFGTNRLINIFCVKFPLLVWVAAFGLLFGSIFGSLLVTIFFRNQLLHQHVYRNHLFDQPVLRNCFLTSSFHQSVPHNHLSCRPVRQNCCVQNSLLFIG